MLHLVNYYNNLNSLSNVDKHFLSDMYIFYEKFESEIGQKITKPIVTKRMKNKKMIQVKNSKRGRPSKTNSKKVQSSPELDYNDLESDTENIRKKSNSVTEDFYKNTQKQNIVNPPKNIVSEISHTSDNPDDESVESDNSMSNKEDEDSDDSDDNSSSTSSLSMINSNLS